MQRIYGIHAVESLLRRDPGAITRLLVQKGRNDRRRAALVGLAREQNVSVEFAPRETLDELVEGRHQGVVAETNPATDGTDTGLGWREADLLAHVEQSAAPVLLLVLDGVTDPHNLGACLRSADAAGVDAVIAPKDRSASLTPVARKVACGAADTVPFVQVTNLRRTLDALKARGVWLYGAAGEAEISLYDNDLKGSLALVLGAEGAGLRRLTREACDVLVHLPMAGAVSSLNVSVAAGVCLFEAVRQRR
tara:strand:+ start:523 stop:1272 length:750 start_codon:yes stop_codon:yes gene_type:complete